MDSLSGPDFCLLCRSALPSSDCLDWYTHHLENVHTVYFHVDLFMALTFVSEDKIDKLTSYIKSISNIKSTEQDKIVNTTRETVVNNKNSDADRPVDNYNRVSPGLKRKSEEDAESRPAPKVQKEEDRSATISVTTYCGPFRCTECGWESDLTRNAVSDSALKHWNEVHGNVLKMELEDVPTEELVTLEELFKFVVKCSLPDCLAVYGSSSNRNDCLLKIKLHWITQHRNVAQVSDDFKHTYLVDSEPLQAYVGNKVEETIEVDEEDNEVANLMEKIDQIKKDLNNEKNKPTDDFENEVLKDKAVDEDFGKLGMTCYDCGQANLNKRSFLQHWNSNHYRKDIGDFKLVCNDTKVKVGAVSLLNYICKCSYPGCGTYIGVNHSLKVMEGNVKDHFSSFHGKILAEIRTPDHYISLGNNISSLNSEKVGQNNAKADDDKHNLKDVNLLPVDCLLEGCKVTDIPKYARHFLVKHRGVPIDQIKVKSVSSSKILGPTDLFTWVLQCGAPNCEVIKTSVQRNNKIRDEFKKHWNNSHLDLGQNYIYKTLISPTTPLSLNLNSNSSPLDIAQPKVAKPLSPTEPKPPTIPTFSNGNPIETFSNGMICTLCLRPTRTSLVHWRSNHPDHPVTSLRMRRLEDDKIMNLRDVYSDNLLRCKKPQCSFISVANKGRPISDAKKRHKKHVEESHGGEYEEESAEEVGSLGYVCMVEGCQASMNRRDQVVEHHQTRHENMSEVQVREIDTDEKKGLVELYRVVKKCGWECGKIFYSDDDEDINGQVEKHTEEKHLGIHGIEPIQLKKGSGGDDAKEPETGIEEQLPEDSDVGMEELAEEELEELDEQDELDKQLDEIEDSQDEEDLSEEELEELDENEELEELEKQISANKAKQEMLAVQELEKISDYKESNEEDKQNEEEDTNMDISEGKAGIIEVQRDLEEAESSDKIEMVANENSQEKLTVEEQNEKNLEESNERVEQDDELDDLDEDLDEQDEELEEQNESDED